MQIFARIEGGVVREIVEVPDDLRVGVDIFDPETAETLVPCDAFIVVGQLYAGGSFEPAPPIEPPPAPPPSSCSKLGLKRAFEEKGLWPTVRAMIASDADMQEDWDLTIEPNINDPLVKKAVLGLAQLGISLSDADVQALVTRANELVQPAPVAA